MEEWEEQSLRDLNGASWGEEGIWEALIAEQGRKWEKLRLKDKLVEIEEAMLCFCFVLFV